MVLVLPNYICTKIYDLNQTLEDVHEHIVTGVARVSIGFVVLDSTHISISPEKDLDPAKSASDIVLLYTISVLFFAWVVDFFSSYTVSKSIYGLLLSGGASIFLAGADLRESREQLSNDRDTCQNDLNRAVLRGLSFALFGVGFFIQVLVIALPEIIGPVSISYSLATDVANVVLPLCFIISFVIFFDMYDILSISLFFVFVVCGFILLAIFANTLFGPVAAGWTFIVLLILYMLSIVLYLTSQLYTTLLSVVDETKPLPFE